MLGEQAPALSISLVTSSKSAASVDHVEKSMHVPDRLKLACAVLLLLPAKLSHAEDIKAPIRGLVSMGAYRFVGYGGDPVNTLGPLDAKPGIFGGLVLIASWKQLQ